MKPGGEVANSVNVRHAWLTVILYYYMAAVCRGSRAGQRGILVALGIVEKDKEGGITISASGLIPVVEPVCR